MRRPLRLPVIVAAAALLGWATPPAAAQVRAAVGYYPTTPFYYPQPHYPGPTWGYAPVPRYSYWYGYQYQWHYAYRPWTGYSSGPSYYSPPGYWGYYARPPLRGGYWRSR
jgi:hypothetical protein